MTSEQHTVSASLRVGGRDDDLEKRLDAELTAFNTAADGAVTEPLSVRATHKRLTPPKNETADGHPA